MSTPDSKIVIIGAGVFGLSTALHLKRRGYKSVTIFDYQQYDQNAYHPENGCDAASADLNKIYRCTYGDWKEYQDLAMKGRPIWLEWNEKIRNTPAHLLPKGLTPEDQPFVNSGFVQQSLEKESHPHDLRSLEEVRKAGLAEHIFVKGKREDLLRLKARAEKEPEQNWFIKLHALGNHSEGQLYSFLDTFAGYTRADKACTWARHLCEQAGVKFVLGPKAGRLDDLIYASGSSKKVVGIRTEDGKSHPADKVIIACGGWTPGIVPECAGVLEATAGSVINIQLPHDRPDLWDKYSPEKFPTWTHGMLEGYVPEYSGFYGFPRTPDGILKIGYRGRKWTNFQTHPKTGKRISTPKTKYTPERAGLLPKRALAIMKHALGELFPDLKPIGIRDTRMCWYTDSLDDSFVIDYVPGYDETLFVASGGSGHGFKFLPVLGEHVVNQLEKKSDQFTPLWKWRTVPQGHQANGLEEGEMSGRNLARVELGTEDDLKWERKAAASAVEAAARAKL